MTAEPEPFVDAAETGRFLHLRPRRVLELARLGELPAYPVGPKSGVSVSQKSPMPSVHAV